MLLLSLLILGVYSKHTFSEESKVKSLNNTEFNTLNVGRDNHSWFILFYRPTCPHCQKVMPIWEQLGNYEQNHSKIAAVNWYIIKQQSEDERQLANLFNINGVPTMILISDGGNLHHYSGNRTLNTFVQFIDNNWQNNTSDTPAEKDDIFDASTVMIILFLLLIVLIVWIYFQEKKEYETVAVDQRSQVIELEDMSKQIEI